MEQLFSNGIKMNMHPEKFGELRESNDILDNVIRLRERMEEDGYLLIRGLLDPEAVLRARQEILLKFAIIGEIDDTNFPLMDAIYSQNSFRENVNLRAFSQSVRAGAHYQDLCFNEKLIGFYKQLLGGAIRGFSFQWPRLVRPGEGCGIHYDAPYMNRGTTNVYTSWIPIGNVTKQEGALIVLENSHKHETLINGYAKRDVDKEALGWFSNNPITVQNEYGGRWLSTDFKAGDVLCFGMVTMHAALDNHSPINRCRLTSDTRYQLASDPIDERFVGEDPEVHGKDKVFFPGLGSWGNEDLQDEWKKIDKYGRLIV